MKRTPQERYELYRTLMNLPPAFPDFSDTVWLDEARTDSFVVTGSGMGRGVGEGIQFVSSSEDVFGNSGVTGVDLAIYFASLAAYLEERLGPADMNPILEEEVESGLAAITNEQYTISIPLQDYVRQIIEKLEHKIDEISKEQDLS